MNEHGLYQQLKLGEDTSRQFKRTVVHIDSFAAEIAAFTNSGGGTIFLGVNDDGSVAGLSSADIRALNQLLSNASSQHVRPPVHPRTENVMTENGLVMVVRVPNELTKPYLDLHGRIWVKQGSDKRHVTAREEIQRMFQLSGLVHADRVPVEGTSSNDIDENAFRTHVEKRYESESRFKQPPLNQILQNIGLGDGKELNLSGLHFFDDRDEASTQSARASSRSTPLRLISVRS